ncbi:hypothetical protein LUZ60_006810 [Juncus effusus]|nr:hypothetical protein LUZ60_006810 [Juncus effusus]
MACPDHAGNLTASYVIKPAPRIFSMIGHWIFHKNTTTILRDTPFDVSPLRNHLTGDINRITRFEEIMAAFLPHLLAIIVIIVVVSRVLHYSLSYLKVPLITGILVFSFRPKRKYGISINGDHGDIALNPRNRRLEHVFGGIGILYSVFMIAVKVDARNLFMFWKKEPLIISFASMSVPTVVGLSMYVCQHDQLDPFLGSDAHILSAIIIILLAGTLPIALTEILEELGLLNSELGRLALTCSLLQFALSYLLLIGHTVLERAGKNGLWTLLTYLGLATFIFVIVQPYVLWVARTTPSNARVRGVHITVIAFLALMVAMVSDIGGCIFTDGPIMLGLVVPHGPPLGTALLERVELLAKEVFLPIVFMHEGFYIDFARLKPQLGPMLQLEIIILVIFITKFAANTAAALYCKMSLKDGLILGLIMNFKGIGDMLLFFHFLSERALLEFLELSSSLETGNSICIYNLHLVELKGRNESSLICHGKNDEYINISEMDIVHDHFINFELTKKGGVTVLPFTSIAPLSSIHQDVCSLIIERHIAFIIVPFPRKDSLADLEADPASRDLVPVILEQAPCSVGIMVYHGMTRVMESCSWQYNVGVIFVGGKDDREAIAIVSRMASHPSVYLNVLRFIVLVEHTYNEIEKAYDDEVIVGLQVANAANNRVALSEIPVGSVEQIFSTIGALGDYYDLMVAGRKQECLSILGQQYLAKWTESPELGMIGDMLVTEISMKANVLIVQQHKL